MNFISLLQRELPRSSAGSEKTADEVMSMCRGIKPEKALFIGDDCYTPKLIGTISDSVMAAFTDENRARLASEAGLDASVVQLFELPKTDGGFGLVWYNGAVEFDGVPQRLERLKEVLKEGGTLVYRALCWLTEPSPDTKIFCQRRFGVILPLDRVLSAAKEQGYGITDFYIAPKTDWTSGYYIPLLKAAEAYAGSHSSDTTVSVGMSELKKESDIFDMHCEEYSYVYFILKLKG